MEREETRRVSLRMCVVLRGCGRGKLGLPNGMAWPLGAGRWCADAQIQAGLGEID